jgi:hypothetical protein
MNSIVHGSAFRLFASGAHLATSAAVATALFALVYVVWYPAPLFDLSAGKNLFLLVVMVDVVLGPLLTLVVAAPSKSRRELTRDIGLIALIQLSALAYGVHVVAQARPAFIVYNSGQFNVVNANEIEPEELAKARAPFDRVPLLGPRLVGAPLPEDERERNETMFSALAGGSDVFQMPRYYVPYESVRAEVAQRAMDLKALAGIVSIDPVRQGEMQAAGAQFGYLPLVVRRRLAAAVVNRGDGHFVEIQRIDVLPD